MNTTTREQIFVGSWLVAIHVGESPSVLRRDLINPLFADALASFSADGTFFASGCPDFQSPRGGPPGLRLLVSSAHGSWAQEADRGAAIRCAAVLYQEDNRTSVATVLIDATVQLDPENDTLSGPYSLDWTISRAWTSNPPFLDGSVQAWRVGPPSGTVARADP